jgi:hypothetical protein
LLGIAHHHDVSEFRTAEAEKETILGLVKVLSLIDADMFVLTPVVIGHFGPFYKEAVCK